MSRARKKVSRPDPLKRLATAPKRFRRQALTAVESFEKHRETLLRASMAADRIGKARSGGWIGYHSRVYKADLQPVLPGEHFDTRWGLDQRFAESRGRWGRSALRQAQAEDRRRWNERRDQKE